MDSATDVIGDDGSRRWRTRGARWSSSRTLVAIECAAIVLAAASIATLFSPEPIGDWFYYWDSAGQVDRYERGGAVLWLVAAMKAFGLHPHLTMLGPNLVAALSILMLARRVDAALGAAGRIWWRRICCSSRRTTFWCSST